MMLLGLIAATMAFSSLSAAYLPPVYIANPDTGECRYYFAGDAVHFNELPGGNWYIVGISETNLTECQDRCFFNGDKFWSEVLKVTRANLSISDVPLDYRVFTELGCLCSGNGIEGCENWCSLNNGILNQTNWTGSVSCQCSPDSWIAGSGCPAEGYSPFSGAANSAAFPATLLIAIVSVAAAFLFGFFVSMRLIGKATGVSRTGRLENAGTRKARPSISETVGGRRAGRQRRRK